MSKPIRILIADNDLEFSESLKAFLDKQDDTKVISIVRDGQGTVNACEEALPDVVLIDLHLPVLDSIKTIQSIVSRNEHIKVLSVSAIPNDRYAIEAVKETGNYLGEGISNILRALDPPAIVIGGRILQVWNIIYPEILNGLSRHSFFGLEKKVKILPSSLSEKPRLIGSATMALNEFLRDYKITK